MLTVSPALRGAAK